MVSERLSIDPEDLKTALEQPGRSQSALAKFLNFSSPAIVNRMTKGERKISAHEADLIRAYLESTAVGAGLNMSNMPSLPLVDPALDYLAVEVLPTYAGMGGGGTGDADKVVALLPRTLVEDELKAKPADLLVINVRGNSMEPVFFHGDQLVIDRRDTRPTQPGPFALLYADGYVVKNVEVLRAKGKLRIFSTNPIYTDDEEDPESVTIMGRPVWFARRL